MKTPPLLMAAALLFWGWQTGQLAVGVLLALVLEGARFVSTRFEWSTQEFNRIWNLCLLGALTFLVILYVSQKGLGLIFALLQWAPLILFPLVAAQLYSVEGKIPAQAFRIFYRAEKDTDGSQNRVAVLYPYVCLCLISASAVSEKNEWFYWAMGLLCAWALWRARSPRYSRGTWAAAMGLILLAGFWGSQGFFQLRSYVDSQVIDWLSRRFQGDLDPFKTRTAIGDIAELKRDDTILYHVDYEKGRLRQILLPQSSYNIYRESSWYAAGSEFKSLTTQTGTGWSFETGIEPEKVIRISMGLTGGKGLLLAPNAAFHFEDLPVQYMQYSPMGAVRVEKGPGFVNYRASVHPAVSRNGAPTERDLKVPDALQPVLRKIAENLRLASRTDEEAVQTVNDYFENNFTYSLDLKSGESGVPPLVDFLTRTRSGHCEYFATAAVLLLRQAGIPARYTFGYSANEYNWLQDDLVVRARDAHAWAIAWVNGRWRNVDATPPAWIKRQKENASSLESLFDVGSQIGFLFSKFRWGEQSEDLQTYLLMILIPPVVFLVWRIYSRTRRADRTAGAGNGEADGVPAAPQDFKLIEGRLNRLGFVREEWETYSRWLRRIQRENPEVPVGGLEIAIALYSRKRFDPQGLTSKEEALLQTEIRAWLQTAQSMGTEN
ncbi:MAG: hypothetical protein GWM98_21935 [Nitrospinaceae bacterium]|nr:transglutaminase family protein [Nitrospinaceae bacterium]NIR56621.1 transglutaminase family protein [Nitrospinaceae bacterium]NIS87084.1 transglutaminase family protein [Nitrospinaceae bacterium]NIT83938.1 transglutaminase family protein [Nitrospinaceae bacterium]NIU46129.1 transglutaminase family protein [Nitrospinaceae bacterium]